MAHIRRYKDKWRAEVYSTGTRLSKVCETKREAQAWALETEASLTQRATGFRTFNQAVTRYLKDKSADKAGHKWEKMRLAVMVEYFGGRLLGELDAPDIVRWRDGRLKVVSASTVVREANLLKHVFRTARDEWRWMENDPFRGVKLPMQNQARKARWTWQLIKKVLRAGQRSGPKTREAVEAFHIALRTGMRLQEVLQAPPVFDKRRQVVELWKTKTTAKGVKVEVPVGRIAAKLLDRPAFTVAPNEASTLFRKLTKANLIEGLTFHDSRGSALTYMSKKIPVEILAKVSRHKNVSLLVNTYYRPTMDEIARQL